MYICTYVRHFNTGFMSKDESIDRKKTIFFFQNCYLLKAVYGIKNCRSVSKKRIYAKKKHKSLNQSVRVKAVDLAS